MTAGRTIAPAYALGAVVLLAALYAWQRGAYLNYAEGVYLFSARLTLDGAVPYRDFIAAHPPLLYYTGAGVLAVSDSLDGVRLVLAGASFATGALTAAAVWRLTHSRPGAVLAGWAAILAPWSLHEHAMLMPETFGAPLVLGAALLAARPRTAAWAGVVAAIAIGFKWPFILPGLALVLVTPAKRRYLAAFALTFATGVLLSFALFGTARLYDLLVGAQQEVGWHSLHELGGLAAQGAWNLAPLLVAAAFGVALAREARDPQLARAVLAVAAATLLLVATITKTGTYLNTISLAEPPLVVLAAAGSVWLLRARPRRRAAVAAVAAAGALAALQIAALVAQPTDPGLFVRPLSAPAHGWPASAAAVDEAVRAASACPAGIAYSRDPFHAFVARRPMPGDEPDQFLFRTSAGAAAARAAAADTPVCP